MDPYLYRLGLYQMAIMGDCQLDKSLMITLVERWRPETSTFHLPVVRADSDARGSVLSMGIVYLRYFKFLVCYFFLKSNNLILQIQKIQKN
jgi:hypothetical protein